MADGDDDLEGFDPTPGEYVLGVLEGTERAAANARVAADPAFAADVALWEAQLVPLIAEVAPVTPPAAVWRRIAMQLGMVEAGARRPRLTQQVGFWQALTAASLAAAAASLIALVAVPRPVTILTEPAPVVEPQPLAIASLKSEAGQALFVATLDPATKRLAVAPADVSPAPGHSHELWLIPASGPPRSLGIVYADHALTLNAPGDLASGATLAVSAEPVGGSPTGLPTGPVVAVGKLAA